MQNDIVQTNPAALTSSDPISSTGTWSVTTGNRFYRSLRGKKLDKQLLVFAVAVFVTVLVLGFSIGMIASGSDQDHFSTYMSLLTFIVGAWFGYLSHYLTGNDSPTPVAAADDVTHV